MSAFPLPKLPLLPIISIIRLMKTDEQIKLALSSTKMEQNIKISRIKTENPHIWFSRENSTIGIFAPEKTALYCDETNPNLPANEAHVTRETMAKWAHYDSVYVNLGAIFEKIQNLYIFERLTVAVIFPDMNGVSKQKDNSVLLSALSKCTCLILHGKWANSEDLKFVLENTPRNRKLNIQHLAIPADFQRQEMFNFKMMICNDSSWIRLKDLYSIRNLSNIELRKAKFTLQEANQFIKYWVDNKEDMFLKLEIDGYGEEGKESDPDKALRIMFDGVLALAVRKRGIYVKSAPGTNKTRPFLTMTPFSNGINLRTSSFEDNCCKDCGKTMITNETDKILELLQKKRELEGMLEIEEFRNREETVAEIQREEETLVEMKVEFKNGMACVVEEGGVQQA